MIAVRDLLCSSCGDSILTGQPLYFQPIIGSNKKEPICFRCHPLESETAKLKLNINIRKQGYHNTPRPSFNWRQVAH